MLVKETAQRDVVFSARSCTFEKLHENANSQIGGIFVIPHLPLRSTGGGGVEAVKSGDHNTEGCFFNGFLERERERDFIRTACFIYNTHQNKIEGRELFYFILFFNFDFN